MKRVTYECDRCGAESNIRMPIFECQFGRPRHDYRQLGNLKTGHLCRKCEAKWCNIFFNNMVSWINCEGGN